MSGEGRLYFLDNLRTFLIFLVVLFHSGVVYESSGFMAPYWLVDDPATSDLPGLVNLILALATSVAGNLFVCAYKQAKDRPAPPFMATE